MHSAPPTPTHAAQGDLLPAAVCAWFVEGPGSCISGDGNGGGRGNWPSHHWQWRRRGTSIDWKVRKSWTVFLGGVSSVLGQWWIYSEQAPIWPQLVHALGSDRRKTHRPDCSQEHSECENEFSHSCTRLQADGSQWVYSTHDWWSHGGGALPLHEG